jgi:hypothetical protein
MIKSGGHFSLLTASFHDFVGGLEPKEFAENGWDAWENRLNVGSVIKNGRDSKELTASGEDPSPSSFCETQDWENQSIP